MNARPDPERGGDSLDVGNRNGLVGQLDSLHTAGERDVNAFDVAKTGDIAILESRPQQPSEVFFFSRSAGLSGPRWRP